MNISLMVSGTVAIVTGVILIYQFPFEFVFITIITTIIGIIIGVIFGALFDYQTLLTGYINGLMIGLMAPMIGAAASLNMMFLLFIEIIFIFSLFLLAFSARHT